MKFLDALAVILGALIGFGFVTGIIPGWAIAIAIAAVVGWLVWEACPR